MIIPSLKEKPNDYYVVVENTGSVRLESCADFESAVTRMEEEKLTGAFSVYIVKLVRINISEE